MSQGPFFPNLLFLYSLSSDPFHVLKFFLLPAFGSILNQDMVRILFTSQLFCTDEI